MAKYQSIKDKQGIIGITNKQAAITRKRNNQVNDNINKACRKIINYRINNDIGILVLGYNDNIQDKINIGRVNNQNFVNIPIGNIRNKLEYLCKLYNITYIKQEESYTSKASFFDGDEIPTIGDNTNQSFSGNRIGMTAYGEPDYAANAFAMAGWIAGYFLCEGLARTEGTMNWENFMKAMETSEFKIPMGGTVNYKDGQRLGTQSMSLLKVSSDGTAWENVKPVENLNDIITRIE